MFNLQPYTIQKCPRHIRVYSGGDLIVSSRNAILYLDHPYPVYYFPREEIANGCLIESSKREIDPERGEKIFWHLEVASLTAENAASTYTNPPVSERADLSSYITFDWDTMDAWYEEEEEVFRHPRNPYHRVDALSSSRRLELSVDGQLLARTYSPVVLFETGLPVRYYINQRDINIDLLERSETLTRCPYKGTASYYNIRTNDRLINDGAWCYAEPIAECSKIRGLICFYNEIIDIIEDESQFNDLNYNSGG